MSKDKHTDAGRRKRKPILSISKKRRLALKLIASHRLSGILAQNGISLSDEPLVEFPGCTTTNSQKAYKKHWRNFALYCELRGDFESLLVFHANVPKNTPSVKRDSLREYLQYKSLPRGTPLQDQQGRALQAVDGLPVLLFYCLYVVLIYCVIEVKLMKWPKVRKLPKNVVSLWWPAWIPSCHATPTTSTAVAKHFWLITGCFRIPHSGPKTALVAATNAHLLRRSKQAR